VNRRAEGLAGCFMHRFAQGRMGVDAGFDFAPLIQTQK
jgi:hypothetical protein